MSHIPENPLPQNMTTANMTQRNTTRSLTLGSVRVGGGAPVVVQSMTNTDTRHVEETLVQITDLAEAGCELVRLAVLDMAAAQALQSLCLQSPVPLIADIHFDSRLAIAALESGVAGLRINPGNIGGREKVDAVVDAAKMHNAVIRVGVNGGSLGKDILQRYGSPTPEAMVESALGHIRMLEARHFYDIKISLKSSSVIDTVTAYRLLAQQCSYPLHLGVTEAGTLMRGTVKSSVALGILLAEGLGDTIRISLTADPLEEVKVAWELLRALNLRHRGPEIISCPTCGRTEIDLMHLAQQVENHLCNETRSIKVAVMGCVVNGPGEAKEADIGLAGGRNKGIIFRKGEIIRHANGQEALLQAFLEELDRLLADAE